MSQLLVHGLWWIISTGYPCTDWRLSVKGNLKTRVDRLKNDCAYHNIYAAFILTRENVGTCVVLASHAYCILHVYLCAYNLVFFFTRENAENTQYSRSHVREGAIQIWDCADISIKTSSQLPNFFLTQANRQKQTRCTGTCAEGSDWAQKFCNLTYLYCWYCWY